MNQSAATEYSDDVRVAEPARAARRGGLHPVWKIWLPVPLLLLLLDLTFPYWFWNIPKLTGRSDDYGYQFLLDLHELRTPPPAGTTRVVAFGSSVTSVLDQYQAQRLLDARDAGTPVQLRRILSPGMKPSDYRTFFHAERASLHAPVVMYLFNWVDFFNPGFERDVKEGIRYLLPPWQVLEERASYLSLSSGLDLVLAGTSNLYRYRKPIKSSLHDHARTLLAWARSPSGELGFGVYADGYTRQRFALAAAELAGGTLEYLVEPAWLQQQGRVTVRFLLGGEGVGRETHREPGWKTWPLPAGAGGMLEVEADSAWNRRAAGVADDVRLLGVKLRQLPASGASADRRPPYEYPPVRPDEVEPFLRMGGTTGAEFERKWNEVLSAETEFAIRFRKYREGKLALKDRPFTVTDEFAEMEKLVAELAQPGTRVVLVNTPENPWILAEYQDGQFYQGYLRFFRELAGRNPRVEFHDLRDALPVEDFNDWHHLTFIGDLKMGPRFAEIAAGAASRLEGEP